MPSKALYFNKIDSTNSHAMSLGDDPANHGLVIVADEQTAGRGQHGRSWQSAPGTSVLMSVLLFPPPPLRRPALLTAWAAVSVCQLIRQIAGLQPTIKWPNDVLIEERKVCGILIEQRSMGDDRLATVAGIGLNLTQPVEDFAEAGLFDAGSLAMFSSGNFDCKPIAEKLIDCLDQAYRSLQAGKLAELETCWKQRLDLLGKTVVVEGVKDHHHGRVRQIAFSGVEIEVGADKFVRLEPESIKHIYPARSR